MGEPDVGDHTDRRAGDRAQRGDVAGERARPSRAPPPRSPVGAAEQGERHARLVVERTRAGVHVELGGQARRRSDPWCRSCPAEPVMPTTVAPRRRVARRPSEPRPARRTASSTRTTAAPSSATATRGSPARPLAPRANASVDEVVTVARGDERDEARARLERLASRWRTTSRARRCRRRASVAAGERRDLARGQLHPSAPSSSRATTRSSNGRVRPPRRLAGLVALAGDHDDVARRGARRARRRWPRGGRARP